MHRRERERERRRGRGGEGGGRRNAVVLLLKGSRHGADGVTKVCGEEENPDGSRSKSDFCRFYGEFGSEKARNLMIRL